MNVVIIGCGVVGAAIAYELSQVKGLNITVFDQQPPAKASTGAALGVLMGVISHKIKGKAWQMRQTSIQRYETLIPELEALTGRQIPFNRQGILSLCLEGEDLAGWEKLRETRHSQGYQLEIWDNAKLKHICPQVNHGKIIGAVYSPQDRQLDPTALTLALVAAAQHNGVTFKFGVSVLGSLTPEFSSQLETTEGKITADWFVIAAGLGSTPLTAKLNQMVDIRPVLGQALHLSLGHPLGNSDFQPAITGNDVHIVPVGNGDYWVGATVEFPTNGDEIPADVELLVSVKQQAIAFCPELAQATITRTWSGLRPRPEGRPAPVIGKLPGFNHVLLATGHYRNGVLLAPATAWAIREMIISESG
ncbi:FAD dependent oxidoreductase [Cylindrospermum sp. NIES-4074]|nr:FAD dependent oxidoreductase [Cylindrospermum sp. NIES-4074]